MKIFKNKHKLVIKTSAMSDICLSRTLNMVGAPGLDQILGEAEDTNVNKKFVSRAKSASFSSESKFSDRGAAEAWKQARTKGTFWH
jgi:hypothetical protein